MSLTEALRAGAPQAFRALYDEYAGALYAYCYVMVGDEAGDALCDAFVTVARQPGAVPGDDAELRVWLYALARAECVRRGGTLLRGGVTTASADPMRRALARLGPRHREVLALSNVLDPQETAQVLGVAPDTAGTLAREAQRRLEQAAASVDGGETEDSAMLTSLSGEALHRLVTLGYEPPVGQRERVLAACEAATPDGATVVDADGTPLPLDAFSVPADATRQFPRSWPAEPAFRNPGLVEAAPVGLGSIGWESGAESSNPNAGAQSPRVGGTHAKRTKPLLGRRFLPVMAICAAAAIGVALGATGFHHAKASRALVRPSLSGRSVPSGGQANSSNPSVSPTPAGTATAPASGAPRGSTAPAKSSRSATRAPSAGPTRSHKPRPSAGPTGSHKPRPSAGPTRSHKPRPSAGPTRPPEPTPSAGPTRSHHPKPWSGTHHPEPWSGSHHPKPWSGTHHPKPWSGTHKPTPSDGPSGPDEPTPSDGSSGPDEPRSWDGSSGPDEPRSWDGPSGPDEPRSWDGPSGPRQPWSDQGPRTGIGDAPDAGQPGRNWSHRRAR